MTKKGGIIQADGAKERQVLWKD